MYIQNLKRCITLILGDFPGIGKPHRIAQFFCITVLPEMMMAEILKYI